MSTHAITMQFVAMHTERPPRVRAYFDVVVRNEAAGARWFLLPDKVEEARDEPYAVHSADIYRLVGQGEVIIGHFSGAHGFHALRVGGGAQVSLRQLPLVCVGALPASMKLGVVSASRLHIGGEDAAVWFGMEASTDAGAVVMAQSLATQGEVIFAHHTPDRSSAPVTLKDAQRFTLLVNIVTS